MKTVLLFKLRGWLAGAGLLCGVGAWGDPVPAGPVSDYLVHCHSWISESAQACARLADRLSAMETPTRADRLALHLARFKAGREANDCPGLAEIAADHPDYAYALLFLSYCVSSDASQPGGESPAVALLRRAVEIEPDNFLVLQRLLWLTEGFPPELAGLRNSNVDPATRRVWREAMYAAGKARADWWRVVLEDAEPDDPVEEGMYLQDTIWGGLLDAGRRIYAVAMRQGDLVAAEAIQARVRRDLGLDELHYGTESAARASLALACLPALYGPLGLEDVCLSGIEKLGGRASTDGLPLPGYVLAAVDYAAGDLRRAACAANMGLPNLPGMMSIGSGDCRPEATETVAVGRLRAVLEHHGGPRSSEHHRVLAQEFLGGDYRLEGLRAALREDAGNDRARCELATALAGRGDAEGAAALGGDPECMERGDFAWGDIGLPGDEKAED